MDFSQIFQRSR